MVFSSLSLPIGVDHTEHFTPNKDVCLCDEHIAATELSIGEEMKPGSSQVALCTVQRLPTA